MVSAPTIHHIEYFFAAAPVFFSPTKYSAIVLILRNMSYFQAGISDERSHDTAKAILLEMGEFFQIQVFIVVPISVMIMYIPLIIVIQVNSYQLNLNLFCILSPVYTSTLNRFQISLGQPCECP